MDRAGLHAALDALLDAFEEFRPCPPADALVPLSKQGLAPYGIELKAAVRLANDGTLKTVEIGRRRFTSVRHLVALVDLLPSAKAPAPVDDLTDAVTRRAARRVA